jgi:hypothetical protein
MAGEQKRSKLWRWGIFLVAIIAVSQYLFSDLHPPIGVYVVILGFAAAAVTLLENIDKREKAAWLLLMFALGGLEISNLYRDRNVHDAEFAAARREENANFARDVNQITGGPSYAIVTPVLVGPKEQPLCRLAAGIGSNREKFSLYNVRLSVRTLPISNEGGAQHLVDMLTGRNQPLVWTGEIDSESYDMLPAPINLELPKAGTRSYVINVFARNKPTTETLTVRYNEELKRWEYSFKVIRTLRIGGPGNPDEMETLETSNPEWLSTTFIETVATPGPQSRK